MYLGGKRADPERVLAVRDRLVYVCLKLELELELDTSLNLVCELGSLWKNN